MTKIETLAGRAFEVGDRFLSHAQSGFDPCLTPNLSQEKMRRGIPYFFLFDLNWPLVLKCPIFVFRVSLDSKRYRTGSRVFFQRSPLGNEQWKSITAILIWLFFEGGMGQVQMESACTGHRRSQFSIFSNST